jgi:DNA-binding NarL/FixJ family response regulator
VSGGVVRILVADDHPLTRDRIRAALSLDAGLEVVAEAGDGQEAVELARSLHPDVVIMDVRMPRLVGVSDRTRAVAVALKHGIVE